MPDRDYSWYGSTDEDIAWLGNGVNLAQRMRALAEQWRLEDPARCGHSKELLSVLDGEYNPLNNPAQLLPPGRGSLGDLMP
jgi:class 3 adenylate cyclase